METKELLINIKEKALKGQIVDCDFDFENDINVWFHKKLGHPQFVLELNGVVIKSCKSWNPIAKKLLLLINPSFKHVLK